ncbi:HAD family hydrolase [Micrococcaceae bacterium Sec5.7]
MLNDRPGGRRQRGVLFDVDGTLVDSAYIHAISWWRAFRQAGFDIPMAEIHRSVGMGGDRLVDHLLPADRDRTGDDEVLAAHGAVFATYWPALRAFDGAKDLLAQCCESGLAVALASSARKRDLKALRATLGADSYLHAATSADDAKHGKPEPDILIAALGALELGAADTVYVGDSVWDVYAAAKLSIPTIGVTCGGTSPGELREAGAVEVYSGPRELLDNLRDSAIGRLLARPDSGSQPA